MFRLVLYQEKKLLSMHIGLFNFSITCIKQTVIKKPFCRHEIFQQKKKINNPENSHTNLQRVENNFVIPLLKNNNQTISKRKQLTEESVWIDSSSSKYGVATAERRHKGLRSSAVGSSFHFPVELLQQIPDFYSWENSKYHNPNSS